VGGGRVMERSRYGSLSMGARPLYDRRDSVCVASFL
jgi:hypothetical protein